MINRCGPRFLVLLPLSVLLACWSSGAAQPPDQLGPPTVVAQPPLLDLSGCVHLALEGHPKLQAARASLAAAEDGRRALDSIPVPASLSHELPIRRQQACLGVKAAAAGVDLTEREVVYGVSRAYLTVLYAREQTRVATRTVDRLEAIRSTVQKQLDAGAKDVTTNDLNRTVVYLRAAEAKRVQAVQGEKRALALLHEAGGRGPDCRFEVPPAPLPQPQVVPDRHAAIAAALDRRADLAQATLFAQIACLEIDAQGSGMHLKMETFAAGGDIHARQVPQEVRNGEYRPGALPPEMPTLLVGTRAERMRRASSLSARASAVVADVRNLVALEAEDAFLRWEEAAGEIAKGREAADTADQLADDLTKDFTTGQKVKLDEVISARVLAAQMRAQYVEYQYRQLLALIDLERATGGGFCAGLIVPIPVGNK
jgi:outer membrane protein TolC